jgi:hypothetical protein
MKRLTLGLALALVAGCATSEPRSDAPRSASLALAAGPELVVRAPARASGRLHVERAPGIHLDIEAVGAKDVAARVEASGAVVYEGAFEATRLVHLATPGRTEELRYAARAPASLEYRVHLGPGLARLRVVDDYVEALDERGVARLRTEPAFLVDARGVRRAMTPQLASADGAFLLSFAIDARGLQGPFVIDPAWTVTTALAKARRDNTLTVLPSGKAVTIAGLGIGSGSLSSVEVWDPASSSWTSGGTLKLGRTSHGAALLPSGKIVVVGGDATWSTAGAATSAELYDPTTGSSALVAAPAPGKLGAYAYALPVGGNLVLAVGEGSSAVLDVVQGTWTAAPYVTQRVFAAAAKLPSGKVLVAGGSANDASLTPLSTAELFDPATKAWKAVASMGKARTKAEMQPLPSGKLLVAGGGNQSSAEIYDPVANAWSAAPSMSTVHSFCASVVLPDQRILIVGGDLPDGITDATDIYDPVTNAWSFAGRIAAPRDEFGLAVLASGKVMIAGGSNGSPVPVVEIFDPLPTGQSCLGPGECTSGFCVEGYCCDKGACAAGETCAGKGAPGRCLKVDGSSCTSDAQCGSAHCVDGLCCDGACTGPCGACNLKGSEGKCVAVPAGDAPHGARAACPGDGACRARCGGIELDACTQFPGTAISCAPPSCSAGVESRSRGCEGAGGCVSAVTRRCEPYVCGKDACKTRCDVDADCTAGNTCELVTRKCVIAATCSDDHTVKSPDGNSKDCTPFRCEGSRCLDACTDSDACANGFACDTASGHCVVAAVASTSDAGGCTMGASRGEGPLGAVVVLLAMALPRRRARRARRAR